MPTTLSPTSSHGTSANRSHAPKPPRLLLVAPVAYAVRVAAQLRGDLDAEVVAVCMQHEAETALALASFDLLLVEGSLVLSQPDLLESLGQRSGDTPLLEMNFGITSLTRVAPQVRSALRRRTADLDKAHAAALLTLRAELTESLTGLLLQTELALRSANAELAPALQGVLALVETVAAQLRM